MDILPTGWAWQLKLTEGNGAWGNVKGRGWGPEHPRKLLKTTPSALAIHVTNALFTSELYSKSTKN